MWEGRGNGSQVRELLRAIVRGENLCVDIYLIYIIYYKIYIIYIYIYREKHFLFQGPWMA